MAINKQAIVDAVFQGAGDAGQEPDPADHVVLQRRRSRTTNTIRRRPRPLLEAAGVKDLSMKVWAMPVARPYMLERPARGRADPGGLREDRRQGRDRLLRMGRVSRAVEGQGPRRRRDPRLDRRQRRSGQLPRHAARLRCRRRQQPRAVVQRGVRRPGHRRRKEAADQAERTKLYEEAQVVFKQRGAVGDARPLAGRSCR